LPKDFQAVVTVVSSGCPATDSVRASVDGAVGMVEMDWPRVGSRKELLVVIRADKPYQTRNGRCREPPCGLAQAREPRTVTTLRADMVLTEVTALGTAPNAVN
jgi:hypothetical protein